MKRTTITIVGLLMAGLLIFPIMATGKGFQGGMTDTQRGKGQMGSMTGKTSNLTTEQLDQIEKLQKKFRDDNADTIKQLMTKRFDLNTILGSDKPDADKAKAVQKEISDLSAKLAQKRIDLYIELRKISPDAGVGRGYGKGQGMMMGMMGMDGEI